MVVKNLRPQIDWYHLEKIIQKCAGLSKQRNYEVSHQPNDCKAHIPRN